MQQPVISRVRLEQASAINRVIPLVSYATAGNFPHYREGLLSEDERETDMWLFWMTSEMTWSLMKAVGYIQRNIYSFESFTVAIDGGQNLLAKGPCSTLGRSPHPLLLGLNVLDTAGATRATTVSLEAILAWKAWKPFRPTHPPSLLQFKRGGLGGCGRWPSSLLVFTLTIRAQKHSFIQSMLEEVHHLLAPLYPLWSDINVCTVCSTKLFIPMFFFITHVLDSVHYAVGRAEPRRDQSVHEYCSDIAQERLTQSG